MARNKSHHRSITKHTLNLESLEARRLLASDLMEPIIEFGDINHDSELSSGDLDVIDAVIRGGVFLDRADLDGSGSVTLNDREVWITQIRRSYYGDSNLDGVFDSKDLSLVMTVGLYEDGLADNANWSSGDWNGDGEFDTHDFLATFQRGGFEKGLRPLLPPIAGLSANTGQDNQTTLEEIIIEGEADPFVAVYVQGEGESVLTDVNGRFSLPARSIEIGENTLIIESIDANGVTSPTSIIVTRIPADGSSLFLDENDTFLATGSIPLAPVAAGEFNKVGFDIDVDTPGISANSDVFLVYLRNSNESTTLLDRGIDGTSLFSLSADDFELVSGTVRFDGRRVEINLSELSEPQNAILEFQLIDRDGIAASNAVVSNIQLTNDEDAMLLPVGRRFEALSPGEAIDLSALTPSEELTLEWDNIRFDSDSNLLDAELRLVNNGEAKGRIIAVAFPKLPPSARLENASGTTADGSPYVNMSNAVASGGLKSNDTTLAVQWRLHNPERLRFVQEPIVYVGAENSPPVLDPIGDIELYPGQKQVVSLQTTDIDGDRLTYSLGAEQVVPGVSLRGSNELLFSPSAEHIGRYEFDMKASDGAVTVTQTVRYTVVQDPVDTTRLSGTILSTSREPLAGVRVTAGSDEARTDVGGRFEIVLSQVPPDNTVRIFGEEISGDITYPFIAEKIPLVLEHELIVGVDNQIVRPIYLPPIDMETAVDVVPSQDTIVTTENLEGASLFVAADTITHPDGRPYDGQLSITEVPRDLTPAALPSNLIPDTVVTIQPGDMAFTQPAPLSLPNRSGYAPGTILNLWSINPLSGAFDNVGEMRVNFDGQTIDTVFGGVITSSWHFASPPPGVPNEPGKDPAECDCPSPSADGVSRFELQTGTYVEDHQLVSYSSIGENRSVRLVYDSLRADSRPIIRVSYDNVPRVVGPFRLAMNLEIADGNFRFHAPGSEGDEFGLSGGFNFWRIPEEGGDLTVGMQADLKDLPTGRYQYTTQTGFLRFDDTGQATGSLATSENSIVHINERKSPFGAGWGLAEHQWLVENGDSSILLVKGNGDEAVFTPTVDDNLFLSPAGDFSTLERTNNGFRRTMKDQTVYEFNSDNLLANIIDRNQRVTRYIYEKKQLVRIVDPVGLTTRFEYENGQVRRIIDPANRITTLTHNDWGDLIAITDPDLTQRQWKYDAEHRIIEERTKRGYTETTKYDEFGRVREGSRTDGSLVTLEPAIVVGIANAQNRNPDTASTAPKINQVVSRYVQPDGAVKTYSFDDFGQVVSTSTLNGPGDLILRSSENLVSRINSSRGFSTSFDYDNRGNVIEVVDEITRAQQEVEFFPGELYGPGLRPFRLDLVDINGDTMIDVFAANNDGFSVLLGTPDGRFGARVDTATTPGNSHVLANLNDDPFIDLVVLDDSGILRTLAGGESGEFESPVTVMSELFTNDPFETEIQSIDIDSDGDQDFLILAKNFDTDQLTLLLSDNGTIHEHSTFFFEDRFSIDTVAMGNLNADAFADLVVLGSDSPNQWRLVSYNGSESGSFTENEQVIFPFNQSFRSAAITLSDMNRDSRSDVIIFNGQDVHVLLNSMDGYFNAPVTYVTNANRNGTMALVDVNEDGNDDILTVSTSIRPTAVQISMLANNSFGEFETLLTENIEWSTESTLLDVAGVADLDGDGFQEVLMSDSNGISILDNEENQRFVADRVPDDISLGQATTDVLMLDVDGINNLDIVASVPEGIMVVQSSEAGRYTERTLIDAGSGVDALRSADFNLDGRQDLAMLQNVGFSILYGDGVGGYSVPLLQDLAGTNIADMSIGMINDDEIPDIILGSTKIVALLGSEEGSFGKMESELPRGVDVHKIALGDFNGDQKQDVVFHDFSANEFNVFFGNGDGRFDGTENYALPDASMRAWDFQVVDIDQDGDDDVIVLSRVRSIFTGEEGRLSIYRNDGGILAHDQTIRMDHRIRSYELEIAEMNGDGLLDIVTLNGENLSRDRFVSIHFNSDTGFHKRSDYSVVAGHRLNVSDINNDGKMDFIVFNENGEISMRINGLGAFYSEVASQEFIYDPDFNRLVKAIDELGRITTYDINPANGNALSMTQIVGELDAESDETDDVVTSYRYTDAGLIDVVTDPLGRLTDYDYDDLGRLTKVTFAVGTEDEAFQTFGYDNAGNLTSFTDENGNVSRFEYDAMNRQIRTVASDPDDDGPLKSPVTLLDYDEQGNLTLITDPLGAITQNEYDPLDRNILTIEPDPDGNGPLRSPQTIFAYDLLGNLTSVIDSLGNTTRYEYDARRRRTATIDPAGGLTRFGYDTDDNLTLLIDPVGNATRFNYDARNRLTREIDPLGNPIAYSYDVANNVVRKVDRNERETIYEYDELDRLTLERWVGGNNEISYSYDKASNLLASNDSFSSLAWSYDNRDRVKTVDNDGTPNMPQVLLEYAYDGVGNVLSVADTITGSTAVETGYQYDSLNRLTELRQSGATVADKRVTFQFNSLGQYERVGRFDDLVSANPTIETIYDYDERHRLTGITHNDADGSAIAFFRYGFDDANRITSIEDTDGLTTYSYDARHQLTGADRAADDARGDELYEYDVNGNRTDSHLHGDGYETGSANRLESDGIFIYEYDREGNQVRRTSIETGEYRVFDWDHRNRLVRVTDFNAVNSAVLIVGFEYDVLDRRILKSVDETANDATDAAVMSFVYDREDVILDFIDSDGFGPQESELDRRYLQGNGIDEVLVQGRAAKNEWFLTDHLGTIRDIVGDSGMNRRLFDSFGILSMESNPSLDSRYTFTGRELDVEINLLYHRARFLDPKIGRFISEDPIRRTAPGAPFGYADNKPLKFVDPSGNVAQLVGIAVVAAVIILDPDPANTPESSNDVTNPKSFIERSCNAFGATGGAVGSNSLFRFIRNSRNKKKIAPKSVAPDTRVPEPELDPLRAELSHIVPSQTPIKKSGSNQIINQITFPN